MDKDDRLKRKLFYILWNASKLNLEMLEGFVEIDNILKHSTFTHNRYSLEDIQRAVNTDPEHRFLLTQSNEGNFKIRFNPEYKFPKPENYNEKELAKKDKSLQTAMAFYLRHVDLEQMSDDGYITVDNLLGLQYFYEKKITLEDIKRAVNCKEVQRCALVKCEGKFKIKALHGHTIPRLRDWCFKNWEENTSITEICSKCLYSTWEDIKVHGFRKENAFHAFFFLRPQRKGYDAKKDVIIYIDAGRARKDGAKFYNVPENKMIATQGIGEGIGVKYFRRVIDIQSGQKIVF
jgi:RNA:NAD 2'-phosphotransferase (TPT1/KptA family)